MRVQDMISWRKDLGRGLRMRLWLLLILGSYSAGIEVAPEFFAGQNSSNVARLEGIVVDAGTNLPLSNVRVQVTPGSVTTRSGSNGRFEFDRIAPGSYVLHTERPGYSSARLPQRRIPGNAGIPVVLVPGQRIELTLSLSPAPVVKGRVLDHRGLPVVRVRVIPFRLVWDGSGVLTPAYFPALTTNDLGEFRSASLDSGEYGFKVEPPMLKSAGTESLFYASYYPGVPNRSRALPVRLESGVETQLNDLILLPAPGGALRLEIVNDASQAPSTGKALVYVRRKDETTASPPISMSETTKVVEIGHLAPGSYDIEAYFPLGSATAKATVEILDRDVTLDFLVRKSVEISGRVVIGGESGRAVSGVRIRLVDPSLPGKVSPVLISRPDGTFAGGAPPGVFPIQYRVEVTNIPTGAYVAAVRSGDRDVLRDGLDLRDARSQNIDVILGEPPATLEGSVVDPDGRPVPAAIVALIPDDEEQRHLVGISTTDTTGNFAFQGTPGAYRAYSWFELEGAAYRNAEFMKRYDGKGFPVRLQPGDNPAIRIQALSLD